MDDTLTQDAGKARADLYGHQDILKALNDNLPLREKLEYVHGVVREQFPFIVRIAAALYEPKTDQVETFLYSSEDPSPLEHYQAQLSDCAALREILDTGRPRLVNDLDILADSDHEHTRRLREYGYQSSYTLPMFYNGTLLGFLFFNAREQDVFRPDVLHHLDLFGHLISLLVINEVTAIHTLLGALKTALEFTHHRDFETGAHLDRMSRYARLIALDLAERHQLNDDYIEHLFLFAPLHDIGKIGIPDRILLKPDKLSDEEFAVMKKHVEKGREIIEGMVDNFGLQTFEHVDILRNIAQYHHEAMNGSGYPYGLGGEEIPIEARIVQVADVFDALTSKRPYKDAWSNDEAFAAMKRLAGPKLDSECVAALERSRAAIEEIQARFNEDGFA